MKELHLALIGGPQYDGLLEMLPKFEEQHGYKLYVGVCLPHMELNGRMAAELGTEHGCYDLISTHTKYSPSQAEHLMPLDEFVSSDKLSDFVPRVLDLCQPAGIRKSYAGGHSFAIPKATPDPEGGLALAKYLSSPDVQWYEASADGDTPVRQSVFQKMKSALSGHRATARDAKRMNALEETITHHAMIPPKFAKYLLIEEILWAGVQEAIAGKQTPRQALYLMEENVREVLT